MRSTVITLGLTAAAGALLLSGCHGGNRPEPAPAPTTAAPASPAPVVSAPGSPAPTTTATASDRPTIKRTINGTLFYSGTKTLATLRGGRLTTVLKGDGVFTAEVSPDGRHIASVDGNGDLVVAKADGTGARKLPGKAVGAGFGPTWSGDSARVVIARSVNGQTWQAGSVRISDGRFTALPKSIQDNIHFRLTGDGTRYFYSDGRCAIRSARSDGTGIKTVPGLGLDAGSADNPQHRRACDIVSLNRAGSRMTVDLHVGNDTDGDIAGSQTADAVIDTATGKTLPLPVHGTVLQVLYLRDDTLLVRSGATLTLLSADLKVLATRAEPSSVRGLVLRGYTL